MFDAARVPQGISSGSLEMAMSLPPDLSEEAKGAAQFPAVVGTAGRWQTPPGPALTFYHPCGT